MKHLIASTLIAILTTGAAGVARADHGRACIASAANVRDHHGRIIGEAHAGEPVLLVPGGVGYDGHHRPDQFELHVPGHGLETFVRVRFLRDHTYG